MAENLKSEAVPDGDVISLLSWLWRDPRLNVFCSLLWLPLGWTIASWAPWLGQGGAGVDEVVNVLAPLTTFLLVAWNLLASVRLVHRSGHTLSALPLTLVQILLFTLLFYQFACHVGAEQYTWEHSPGVKEWIVFAVAHAARATDVIDGIEAYGLHIQSIRNVGHLVSLSLILYHLVITVFFLSLFVEWVNRFKRFLWSDPKLRWTTRGTVAAMAVTLLAGFLLSAFIWPGWRREDIVWWPVDNALRVVDFLDVLEVYQYRFHKLPLFAWESTLTFACRFLLAILLAGVVGRFTEVFRLRWLAGFALDSRELTELHETHRSAKVRDLADRRLAHLKALAPELAAEHRRWRAFWVPLAAVGVLLIFGAVPWLLPGGERPAESLAKVAIEASLPPDPRPWRVDRALSALERMGSAGVEALPILVARENELPLEQRLRVIETLGFLGPGASDHLEALLDDEDENVRLAAVSALRQVGPAAAPALIRGFGSIYPEVSETCVAGIRRRGNADPQRLADNLDPNNVVAVVRLLDEVDPYWERRTSENPAFTKAAAARRAGKAIAAGGSLFLPLPEAVEQLREIGPLAAAETEPLEPILFGEDELLSNSALAAYMAVDTNWHDTPMGRRAFTLTVNRFISANDAPARRRAAEVLGRFNGQEDELANELQKSPGKSVAALREASRDTTESVRRLAAVGLVLLLTATDETARKDAASALVSLDGPAREAASSALAERQPLSTDELVLWCRGKDESLRQLAIRVLGEKGQNAKSALPQLVPLLRDANLRSALIATFLLIDPECHREAAQAWVAWDPSLAQLDWQAMLDSQNAAAQLFAIKTSPWIGLPRSKLLSSLVPLLRPEDSELQQALLAAVFAVDSDGTEAVRSRMNEPHELLLFWLKHEDPRLQRFGENLAEHLGAAPVQVIGRLIAELASADAEPRRSLLLVLSKLDSSGQNCSSQLAGLPDSEQAMKFLRAWLADADISVKRFGVMVAGRMEIAARGATGELFSLLAEEDAYLRRAVWYALMRVDAEGLETGKAVPKQFDGKAISQLVLGLRDTDPKISAFAVTALGGTVSAPAGAAAALTPLLSNDHEAVRAAAAKLLKDISPEKIAEAEAGLYDRALQQAVHFVTANNRSAADRALQLIPPERRRSAWGFVKQQAIGESPFQFRTANGAVVKNLGYSADNAKLVVTEGSGVITLHNKRGGGHLASLAAHVAAVRGLWRSSSTATPAGAAASNLKNLAEATRAIRDPEELKQAEQRMKKLTERYTKVKHIADLKVREKQLERIQAEIKLEQFNIDKASGKAPKTASGSVSNPTPLDAGSILGISPDGSRILTRGEVPRTLKLWDTLNGVLLPPVSIPELSLGSTLFSADGRRVGVSLVDSSGMGFQFAIYDTDRGSQLTLVPSADSTKPISSLSRTGDRFASYVVGKDAESHHGLRVWRVSAPASPLDLKDSENVELDFQVFSPNSQRLAALTRDYKLRIWNTDTGKLVAETLESVSPLSGLDFSPDQSLLAVADIKSGLFLFDTLTGRQILLQAAFSVNELSAISGGHERKRYTHVLFSPDGSQLAVAAGSLLKLYNLTR